MIGEKVSLKAIGEEDLVFLMELFNDPETGETVGGWAPPVSLYQQKEWFASLRKNDTSLRYMVRRNDSDQPVGICTFSGIDRHNRTAEINIRLQKIDMGGGLGTEAVRLLLKVAFEYMDLALVYATHLSFNERSRRLFAGLGFLNEGTLRSRAFKHGKRHDLTIHSITAGEYSNLIGDKSQHI